MVDGGIKDILIANEIVGKQKIAALMELCRKADAVCVACDDESNLRDLSKAAVAANVTLHVLVDVNIGMDRCGVDWRDNATIVAMSKLASEFFCHL
jgi:D-serine deaminase-like pyridoxal phosphate-dependent protein